MKTGDRLTLTIEKPAVGGRMIARHDGAIVLVAGAIPGETVETVVEKVQRGTAWATTTKIIEASSDRIQPVGDWSCGGNVFAHIAYDRQIALKQDIIRDAFGRLGKLVAPEPLIISRSPIDHYRMRARLHVQRGRIGFFREGTHQLCDPGSTRQLLPETIEVLRALESELATTSKTDVAEVELSENCSGSERALHLELAPAADPSRLGSLSLLAGVTGISYGHADTSRSLVLQGTPTVTDEIAVPAASGSFHVSLMRHAHSFFQGNRFLLADLVATVVDAVPPGNILDLYAGVGLFAVSLAGRGDAVIAIEGDRRSADDLETNATRAGGTISTRHQSVEIYLSLHAPHDIQTVIVDPPRTGMSKAALAGAIALGAQRVVYVSCDVATLARDARLLVAAGYRLSRVQGFDLFPNTAHVEALAIFDHD